MMSRLSAENQINAGNWQVIWQNQWSKNRSPLLSTGVKSKVMIPPSKMGRIIFRLMRKRKRAQTRSLPNWVGSNHRLWSIKSLMPILLRLHLRKYKSQSYQNPRCLPASDRQPGKLGKAQLSRRHEVGIRRWHLLTQLTEQSNLDNA